MLIQNKVVSLHQILIIMEEFETNETLFAWANENLIGRSLVIDYPSGNGYIYVKTVLQENDIVYLITDFIYEEFLNEKDSEYSITIDKYYPITYRTFGELIENKKYLLILNKWYEQVTTSANNIKDSITKSIKYKNK